MIDEDLPPGRHDRTADGPIRVLLADDQPLMTAGIRMILETDPGIRVVATATDGASAVQEVRRTRPDLVCMDIQMPGTDGLSATRTLISDPDLDCAVLMLTTFQSEDYLVEALRAGASGYLLKNTPPEQLITAVHAAAAGDGLVAPELTGALIRRALHGQDTVKTPTGSDPATHAPAVGRIPPGVELTPREEDVLRLMAEGLSNEEIAGHLVLGRSTVKTHVSNILMKLSVRDRVQAVVWAHRHGVTI